jgi:glycosyltransferase involved in cell wall biosynthesis
MGGINAVAAMTTYSSDDNAADREDIHMAITTYQRTCDLPLHVFDDNSCQEYVEYLKGFNGIFLHTFSENVGSYGNCNRGIDLFRQYHEIDALILLDDDIKFLKPGWSSLYLNALSDEVQLLSFNDKEITQSPGVPHGNYSLSQWSCGVCVTLTRHCWMKAGTYGPFPEKYGWCHIEYNWRCALLGLIPMDGFYDIPGIHDYIKISSYSGSEEKLRQIEVNGLSETVQLTRDKYFASNKERWSKLRPNDPPIRTLR